MTHPLISVLIPTYNRAHTISRALESVLASTYPNVEIIISDNASADATIFRASKILIKSKHPYRILKSDTNDGPVPNWLKAFEASSGEFIKFVWSDDAVTPSTLSRLAEPLISDDRFAFAFCPAEIISNHNMNRRRTYCCGHHKIVTIDKFAVGFGVRIPHLPVSPGCALIRREYIVAGISRLRNLPTECFQRAVGPDVSLLYSGLLDGKLGISCEDTSVVFYDDETSITKNTDRKALNDCYDRTVLSLLQDSPVQRDMFLLLRLFRAIIDRRSERSAITNEFLQAATQTLRPSRLLRALAHLAWAPIGIRLQGMFPTRY